VENLAVELRAARIGGSEMAMPTKRSGVARPSSWLNPAAVPTIAAIVSHTALGGGVAPSTDEAVQRGLTYVIQPYSGSPNYALWGFGCGFSDLDGDGDLDIVVMGKAGGQVGIFENDGTGFFTDRSTASGLAAVLDASGLAIADYNGDGRPDLYITTRASGTQNVLARNDGGFTFTNVAIAAQVNASGTSEGAAWGDYDGDGWLDLFVCQYSVIGSPTSHYCRLYRNKGDGTFENVAPALGVNNPGATFSATWFDYDRDGDVDLYIANDRGHLGPLFANNQLYRNEGDGTFFVTPLGNGANVGLWAMGIACGDFDGNGWPDLYCTNLPDENGGLQGLNPLMLNQGDETFELILKGAGVEEYLMSWGARFDDFDNNGHLDLYVNNMIGGTNGLFLNFGAFPVEDAAEAAGVQGNNGISFNAAVGDVDGDGDQDLLLNNYANNIQLFINHEGQQRQSVRFKLQGEHPNLEAIGGSVDVRVGDVWRFREIHSGGNGMKSNNEHVYHVGLDQAAQIDEAVITWPGGRITRTLTNYAAGHTWTVYRPDQLGDVDGDGLSLAADFSAFVAALDQPVQVGQEMMDLDGNAIVNADDWDDFLAGYDGVIEDCNQNSVIDLEEIVFNPAIDADGDARIDECSAGSPYDLNGDQVVNGADLGQLLLSWGPCPAKGACPADFSADGVVNGADLGALLLAWTG
jgi:hypothetical protein